MSRELRAGDEVWVRGKFVREQTGDYEVEFGPIARSVFGLCAKQWINPADVRLAAAEDAPPAKCPVCDGTECDRHHPQAAQSIHFSSQLVWHELFPEGTETGYEPVDFARWLDAYTKEVEAYTERRLKLAAQPPQAPRIAIETSCLQEYLNEQRATAEQRGYERGLAAAPQSPQEQTEQREVFLFDLVEETRRKLQPYLRIETFPTGTNPISRLAIDTILQAAFEQMASAKPKEPGR